MTGDAEGPAGDLAENLSRRLRLQTERGEEGGELVQGLGPAGQYPVMLHLVQWNSSGQVSQKLPSVSSPIKMKAE